MHIVQIIPELFQGGIERGAIELNRFLVAQGHQSTILSSGGDQKEKIVADGGSYLSFDCKSKNPFSFPSRCFNLIHLLKKLQPDVLHCASRVPCWLGFFAARYLDIPFVTGIHGFHKKKLYNYVLTWADKIIIASSELKKMIQDSYHLSENKLVVIPRGVDMDYFDPLKVDVEWIKKTKENLLIQNKKIFTVVGRITGWKNQETFIKAISLLKKSNPNIVGLCVGRDSKSKYKEYLRSLAFDLKVQENIRFFDAKDHIREIYAMSDKVVSCSIRPEGFGRSMTEALSMGKEVIASKHGGALDIIKEQETGLFFTPGNALELAKALSTPIKTSPKELREYVSDYFSLEQMGISTLNLYMSLKEGKTSTRK